MSTISTNSPLTPSVKSQIASPRDRRLAWGLVALSAVGFLILGAVDARRGGLAALGEDIWAGILLVVFFVALGTLLSLRQPANPIGWLLTTGGLSWLAGGLAESLAKIGLVGSSPPSTGTLIAANINDSSWTIGVLFSVSLPLLLFPDGRTRSRGWRFVLWTMVVATAVMFVASMASTAPVPSPSDPDILLPNPWGIERLAAVTDTAAGLGVAVLLISTFAAMVGIAVRFRSATGVERQQLRWVEYGAILAVVSMLSVYLAGVAAVNVEAVDDAFGQVPTGVADAVVVIGIACVPASFTVAILRYRLYDLQRIVSRTVSYVAVTGLLLATYVAVVTTLSRLMPRGSSLAVAASTLAVAALFQPLRRRMQDVVDRRFNRSRYDADRTVEAFRTRLRSQVDLDTVRGDLLAITRDTMQPAAAALWLRPPDGATP
jgi:hypothetical protein